MVEIGGQVWFGIEPVWYGLVADGFDDPAGLQRVVEEEVVVRRVLVRDCLKKGKGNIIFFLYFCNVADPGYPDPGSEFFHHGYQIPDPGSKDSGSRIRIKYVKY
jgi:hypothetical protein